MFSKGKCYSSLSCFLNIVLSTGGEVKLEFKKKNVFSVILQQRKLFEHRWRDEAHTQKIA